jgi:hypothetical protein
VLDQRPGQLHRAGHRITNRGPATRGRLRGEIHLHKPRPGIVLVDVRAVVDDVARGVVIGRNHRDLLRVAAWILIERAGDAADRRTSLWQHVNAHQ